MVRCLDSALGNEVEKYTLVFVDDILCVSQTFVEHLQHLKNIFEKLRSASMTLNLRKLEFGKEEIKFLGHLILVEGITTDPEKVKAIQEFPTPNQDFLYTTVSYISYVPISGSYYYLVV